MDDKVTDKVMLEFSRKIALLRKEKGYSQKLAASELGITQALLSHYEKGRRECKLDFVVRCASLYGVSCDYLLGLSPERKGTTITVEEIPEPDAAGKENRVSGSIMPVLNKKLISNSLNILFDLLAKNGNKTMITEVSAYLMLAVYKMFRTVYAANPSNDAKLFNLPPELAKGYSSAEMLICEARAEATYTGKGTGDIEPITKPETFHLTTELLSQQYPLFASSLLNLIQNTEKRISGSVQR